VSRRSAGIVANVARISRFVMVGIEHKLRYDAMQAISATLKHRVVSIRATC
jgi:hypothetical protein